MSVLKGYFVPVDGLHRQHISLSTRHVFKLLKPTNILHYLLSKSVISENDAEVIRNVEANESRGIAALDLLFILPNRRKDWYRLFLEALVEGNHTELAEIIDPELTESKLISKYLHSLRIFLDGPISDRQGSYTYMNDDRLREVTRK